MSLIRVIGLLVILAGLFLVGVSGDNHRVPSGRNIAWGAGLMFMGAIAALFGGDLPLILG